MNIASRAIPSCRLLVCASLALCVASASPGRAQEAPSPAFQIKEAFTATEGVFVATAGQRESTLITTGEYEPGQYILAGEYRTEGMDALAMFAADVKTADGKTAFSGYEWTCAAPQWTPFVLYVTLDAKSAAMLRVGNWQRCNGAESKLLLRSLEITAQEWVEGTNLLVNGDFEQSVPDYPPGNWYWRLSNNKGNPIPASSFSVVKNTTYGTGKNVLRMAAPGDGTAVMLSSRSFNMPAAGALELTFWAKADKSCVVNPRIVQSWSGQYTNVRIALTDQWQEVSVNYMIVPDSKRKWFFVRLDMPTDQACTVEFADMKLIYRLSHKGVNRPVAKAAPRPPAEPAFTLPPFDPRNLPSVAKPGEYLVGLNIAGGEWASKDPNFGWPSTKSLDYFKGKGFKLIRLPLGWERLQPKLGEELDPGYAAALVRTIDELGKRDMVVLIDLHNYAKNNGKKLSEGGFTYEQFGDVWERIAKLVKPQQKHIWGYGLMNEPYINGPEKIPFWQVAIDAIRKHDPTTRITVGGEALAGGAPNPEAFHLKDPARALVFEKHFYFDGDGSGRYVKTYEEECQRVDPINGRGMQSLKRFLEACKKYNVEGLIGEYGAPAGDGVDPRWLTAMDAALQLMHEYRMTSTYWAAGEYWTRRGTSYVIGENGWKPGEHEGEDRPQVAILTKYIELQKAGK